MCASIQNSKDWFDDSKYDQPKIDSVLQEELANFKDILIVLDDDPTGTQTVHDVPVYTDWSLETLREAFKNGDKMFYLLTNSRSFSTEKTTLVHQEIAERIAQVSLEQRQSFLIISRGDSTLRGHYPLETETLKNSLEAQMNVPIDGEILCPAFFEGGRYTINDVHYLKQGAELVPAGETEFAKDQTFGYHSSNLKDYVAEKSKGVYTQEDCVSISLDELRNFQVDDIKEKLLACHDFQKVIVNATGYYDLKTFAIALLQVLAAGKKFISRTAAGFPKVLGGISDQPYLTKSDVVDTASTNGGLIIVGSHVKLSSSQLQALRGSGLPLDFIEFNVSAYFEADSFDDEVARVFQKVEKNIETGISTVVFTSRKLLVPDSVDKEKVLAMSVDISSALTNIVNLLKVKPKYVIAKGGITSSDVATKGLGIKKANVLGQIKAGIPVWLTGPESKFPQTPYLIFPGNVGAEETLKEIVEELEG